jgi:hypothetical protein
LKNRKRAKQSFFAVGTGLENSLRKSLIINGLRGPPRKSLIVKHLRKLRF